MVKIFDKKKNKIPQFFYPSKLLSYNMNGELNEDKIDDIKNIGSNFKYNLLCFQNIPTKTDTNYEDLKDKLTDFFYNNDYKMEYSEFNKHKNLIIWNTDIFGDFDEKAEFNDNTNTVCYLLKKDVNINKTNYTYFTLIISIFSDTDKPTYEIKNKKIKDKISSNKNSFLNIILLGNQNPGLDYKESINFNKINLSTIPYKIIKDKKNIIGGAKIKPIKNLEKINYLCYVNKNIYLEDIDILNEFKISEKLKSNIPIIAHITLKIPLLVNKDSKASSGGSNNNKTKKNHNLTLSGGSNNNKTKKKYNFDQ